jgi:hypothetical protein
MLESGEIAVPNAHPGVMAEGLNEAASPNAGAIAEPFFAPNPMAEAGVLYFRVEDLQQVQCEVFSANQQRILVKRMDAAHGVNQLMLTANELGQPGVYLYRLTVGNETFTGRIICVQ